jgi:hypothetical protein
MFLTSSIWPTSLRQSGRYVRHFLFVFLLQLFLSNMHTNPVLSLRQTCNVMSGHRKKELCYFAPRCLLEVLNSVGWCSQRLLPLLQVWRTQRNSRIGDKSTCCDKFLNHILPYFVEVLVQDGIYFIVDFPHHPVSQMLKVSFYMC